MRVLGDASRVEGEGVSDGFAVDLDAYRVHQNEPADQTLRIGRGQFGGDPAAERGADDQDVGQPTVAEKPEVGGGEGSRARLRARAVPETGRPRTGVRQDVGAGAAQPAVPAAQSTVSPDLITTSPSAWKTRTVPCRPVVLEAHTGCPPLV
ncbi:hypothetical protein QF030_007265 [Streptomyces rishiriensis]|uniref:Uncharacterized protein n=1 Tax=Streptomyces rishiriensis TaxID=68264 RepID=A0ABU0P2X8_STRRH|nr:hypothetical protein [Streptomyces rishiriensis]